MHFVIIFIFGNKVNETHKNNLSKQKSDQINVAATCWTYYPSILYHTLLIYDRISSFVVDTNDNVETSDVTYCVDINIECVV